MVRAWVTSLALGGRQSSTASIPLPYPEKGRCLTGCWVPVCFRVGDRVQVAPGTSNFKQMVLATLAPRAALLRA